MHFNTIDEIIEDLKQGRIVIVTDDEDRENEGDLIVAASFARPEAINFMARYGRGLICVPMPGERLDRLRIYPMTNRPAGPFGTDWAISVDAKKGISTGISAFDRARTIEVLIDPKANPEDLVRPGHIFPLRAKKGGVLVRAGHTEAAIDLMRLSGLYPAAVICEIMNEDGTMARTPQLVEFAKRHNLKLCSISSLIEYRRRKEVLIRRVAKTYLPTVYGDFQLIVYESITDSQTHLALVMDSEESPISAGGAPSLVRVHSQCLTGDVFGSQRCDCGMQLRRSLEMIQREARGVLLYMNQEGRGIGLVNKLKAYCLQDKGMDTVEANEALGFKPDLRDYGIGAQILVDLGLKKLRLITNNPRKIVGLEGYGLEVIERVAVDIKPHPVNERYLKAKKEKLGHLI